MISEVIRDRIKSAGGSYFANDNISYYIEPGELEELQVELEEKIEQVLQSLVIDTANDHNTQNTAHRIAKMYLKEVLSGRYVQRPAITEFPNHHNLDEVYTLGPIKFKSMCSHHFVETEGSCWVGIQPSSRVIGISKIARIIDWVARRPQIQEECVMIITDELEHLLSPKGVGVVIRAHHHCMTMRGVEEENSTMVTSVVRGSFRDPTTKSEFFELIKAQGF